MGECWSVDRPGVPLNSHPADHSSRESGTDLLGQHLQVRPHANKCQVHAELTERLEHVYEIALRLIREIVKVLDNDGPTLLLDLVGDPRKVPASRGRPRPSVSQLMRNLHG